MLDILRELIAVAQPYDEEYAYCNYCEDNDKSLGETLKDKMEDFKKEGIVKDYIVRCESFDVSSSLEIGYVSISWITKDGKLDGSVFHWEVC